MPTWTASDPRSKSVSLRAQPWSLDWHIFHVLSAQEKYAIVNFGVTTFDIRALLCNDAWGQWWVARTSRC